MNDSRIARAIAAVQLDGPLVQASGVRVPIIDAEFTFEWARLTHKFSF